MTSKQGLALALALGLTGAGVGCGGGHDKGRATESSTARDKSQLAALHRQVLASQKDASGERYGGLPAYLASRQGNPDRVLSASEGHPARTVQGLSVRVRLRSGRATATAVGPVIPQRDMGSDVETTPARFDLTFTGLHGALPLRSRLFGVIDEHGLTHVPPVTIVRHGQKATVSVHAILPPGDGKVVYAPAGRPLVTWDYTLETY